jgi:hypothetical protein
VASAEGQCSALTDSLGRSILTGSVLFGAAGLVGLNIHQARPHVTCVDEPGGRVHGNSYTAAGPRPRYTCRWLLLGGTH